MKFRYAPPPKHKIHQVQTISVEPIDDSQDVGLDDGGAGVGAGGDSRGRLSPRGIDLEALVEEEVAEASEGVALVQQVEETTMYKAIVQYHQRLPKAIQLQWLSNLKSVLAGFTDARGKMPVGSACSGSDIWVHCFAALRSFWKAQYNLQVPPIESCFVAELEPSKQDFLRQQFDNAMMVADVADVSKQRVWNLQSEKLEFVKWPKVFGGGFSCKGPSKQNSQRKKNVGCVRGGFTSTGETFEGCRQIITKFRPCISFLENVTDITQVTEDDETGVSQSDADYIVSCFEKVGFCVIPLEFSAREYGSPAERVRWWCIILDIPPEHAARAKDLFFTVFNSIKQKPFPVEEPPV